MDYLQLFENFSYGLSFNDLIKHPLVKEFAEQYNLKSLANIVREAALLNRADILEFINVQGYLEDHVLHEALTAAIEGGHAELVEQLINLGAFPRTWDFSTAAKQDNLKSFVHLLRTVTVDHNHPAIKITGLINSLPKKYATFLKHLSELPTDLERTQFLDNILSTETQEFDRFGFFENYNDDQFAEQVLTWAAISLQHNLHHERNLLNKVTVSYHPNFMHNRALIFKHYEKIYMPAFKIIIKQECQKQFDFVPKNRDAHFEHIDSTSFALIISKKEFDKIQTAYLKKHNPEFDQLGFFEKKNENYQTHDWPEDVAVDQEFDQILELMWSWIQKKEKEADFHLGASENNWFKLHDIQQRASRNSILLPYHTELATILDDLDRMGKLQWLGFEIDRIWKSEQIPYGWEKTGLDPEQSKADFREEEESPQSLQVTWNRQLFEQEQEDRSHELGFHKIMNDNPEFGQLGFFESAQNESIVKWAAEKLNRSLNEQFWRWRDKIKIFATHTVDNEMGRTEQLAFAVTEELNDLDRFVVLIKDLCRENLDFNPSTKFDFHFVNYHYILIDIDQEYIEKMQPLYLADRNPEFRDLGFFETFQAYNKAFDYYQKHPHTNAPN